jgi:mono/diheme cytochrome c family protein
MIIASMKTIRLSALASVTLIAVALPVVADHTGPWEAPRSAASKKNPHTDSADAAAGKQIYMTTCAPCHGNSGRGDGPAAAALNPKPANYTSRTIAAESDGSLFWKLSEGRGAMVPFKTAFSEKQRWQLITYIRTLQGKK